MHRKLPSTIVIDVVEREAAALVSVGSDLYLSTRQGDLFKKPEPGDPYDLPVISGTHTEDVVKDSIRRIHAGAKAAGRDPASVEKAHPRIVSVPNSSAR